MDVPQIKISPDPCLLLLLPTQNPALNCVQNSKLLGIVAIYCENRKAGSGLAEEIYHKSNLFNRFDTSNLQSDNLQNISDLRMHY